MRPAMRAIVLPGMIACSACTIIRVEGAARPRIVAGVLYLAPAPGAGHVSFRSSGFGLVPGLHGMTIGAAREEAVLVYSMDDCRVVAFTAGMALNDLLDHRSQDICRPGGN